MNTYEKIWEVIDSFNDWVWCECTECKIDCHSHAIDTEKSKKALFNYLIQELNVGVDKDPKSD